MAFLLFSDIKVKKYSWLTLTFYIKTAVDKTPPLLTVKTYWEYPACLEAIFVIITIDYYYYFIKVSS